jgi:nuclear transport factor 2 (NTF2) superfamily protein
MLTIAEAELALEQAAAFIMRAQVAHPHEFHLEAGAWFSTYGIEGKGMRE